MKSSKIILSLMLTVLFCISAFAITASAIHYPLAIPKSISTDYTVTSGQTVNIEFAIFHRYEHEKIHVSVVRDWAVNDTVVASFDMEFYPTSYTETYTAYWNTSGAKPGKYVVEYWTSFYTENEWHDDPIHHSSMMINVKAGKCNNNHKYDNGKVTQAPTCTADGVNTKTCTVCGKTEKTTIPKTGHKWDEGVIKVASSIIVPGKKVYTCKVCNETKTEDIPAKFNDVDSNEYYASAIEWAFENGITSGTSGSTFSPNDKCTRGQVITFLWRAVGSP